MKNEEELKELTSQYRKLWEKISILKIDSIQDNFDHQFLTLLKLCSIYNKVWECEILLSSRYKIVLNAKVIFTLLLREKWGTYEAIGNKLNMNHASILYRCRIWKELIKIPKYKEIETNLESLIAKKYNLIFPYPKEITDADIFSFGTEWNELMLNEGITLNLDPMPPSAAAEVFYEIFNDLIKYVNS